MKTAFDIIQSQRQIFQEDISNKTNEMYNRNEIELKAKFTVILRVSFTQYNNCRYRIYYAWYFSLATKKLSNMLTTKITGSHKIKKGVSRWG